MKLRQCRGIMGGRGVVVKPTNYVNFEGLRWILNKGRGSKEKYKELEN